MTLPTPVLWLSGPSGVGKTAVGWEVFGSLTGSGVPGAYVDADQLGICYPEPPGDPGRHRLQARNVAAVAAGHRTAGARYVVVSGVIDTRCGVHTAELPGTVVTECRLRAAPAELARRRTAREGHTGGLAEALREAAELDAEPAGPPVVDTTGRTVAEVADEVQRRIGAWPGPALTPRPEPKPRSDGTGGTLLWLCGPAGVGKSTIGFQVYLRTLAAGRPAAYVDVDQLAHAGPRPAGPELRAANLAAVWRGHRRAGARVAVVTGPVPDEAAFRRYAAALPGATITLCRLHAGPDDLTARVLSRGAGGSWAQPGDPLRGRPESYLREVALRAARELDRAGPGRRVDTGGRTVADSVDRVLAATGWPPS